jgi:hypothetical protein
MKNIEEINNALIDLVEKRMELARLNYSDVGYDLLEEELHNAQDDFAIDYGEEFEKVLKKIHEEHCPQTEVLLPIAYLAKKYIKVGVYEDNTPIYDVVDYQQGILIDTDKYAQASLVMLPNPARILLTAAKEQLKIEVWNGEA